ncbi:hypothetical protein [Mycobacterium sp. OAE908]|uniref:hypothetical protein n=1 Tax=Mycobacterium sp. OAE908 TaxID=2817899 RepID=UPI001AE1D207
MSDLLWRDGSAAEEWTASTSHSRLYRIYRNRDGTWKVTVSVDDDRKANLARGWARTSGAANA